MTSDSTSPPGAGLEAGPESTGGRQTYLREGLLGEHPAAPAVTSSATVGEGPSRVRITYIPTKNGDPDGPEREIRVPAGVTLFDAAS